MIYNCDNSLNHMMAALSQISRYHHGDNYSVGIFAVPAGGGNLDSWAARYGGRRFKSGARRHIKPEAINLTITTETHIHRRVIVYGPPFVKIHRSRHL